MESKEADTLQRFKQLTDEQKKWVLSQINQQSNNALPKKVSKKMVNKAVNYLKKINGGKEPLPQQLEEYLNKTLQKKMRHQKELESARFELKQKNGGREPTKEEVNQYLQSVHPKKNKPVSNKVPAKTIQKAVIKYKEQNGGREPTAKQLAQFIEQEFPERIKKMREAQQQLLKEQKALKQLENQDPFKYKLAFAFLKENLQRDPTSAELTNYLGGLSPAKIGQISGSEVLRVQNIIRQQNGGREPTVLEVQNYFQTSGVPANQIQYTSSVGSDYFSNSYIVGFALLAGLIYWMRQRYSKYNEEKPDHYIGLQNKDGLLEGFKNFFSKKKKDDEDDYDHVL